MAITKVVDADGNVIYEHKAQGYRVISEQTAYIMNDMLKGVVEAEPDGRLPSEDRRPARPVQLKTTPTAGSWVTLPAWSPGSGWVMTNRVGDGVQRCSLRQLEHAEMLGDFMRRVLGIRRWRTSQNQRASLRNTDRHQELGSWPGQRNIPTSEMRYKSSSKAPSPGILPEIKTLFDYLQDFFTPKPEQNRNAGDSGSGVSSGDDGLQSR